MKLRIAWLADAEDRDSYSAAETRVLLRALARNGGVVPLWFAVDSTEPPHFWNGIRVFPIPSACRGSDDFLKTLINQQRPHVVLSNIARGQFAAAFDYLADSGVPWIIRMNPDESFADNSPKAAVTLIGRKPNDSRPNGCVFMPFLCGLAAGADGGDDPSAVLEQLLPLLKEKAVPRPQALAAAGPCLVMRQQLFCNASLAQVMFELTNALIELGVPTVPQDEHAAFAKGFVHREEDMARFGAPEKYRRITGALGRTYDLEEAITVHFAMLGSGSRYTRFGVFPSLGPREALYTTGNHTVEPKEVRQLAENFERIFAPSWHVLRPYLEAGLSRRQGMVIPHGIDPAVYAPDAVPLTYPTRKSFRFLQTSFPWIYEKGFDLTIKAFGRAFSNRDNVTLVLRVPRLKNEAERRATFDRLETLVREERARAGSPEILLLEKDVEPDRRGGVFTGASCYVFPLRAEGFGITVLEAMACGLPVIATAWSGPADFLSPRYSYTLRHSNPVAEQRGNGKVRRYHVEPDLDHLTYLLRYVYENQDEAKAMGRRASDIARRDWTWESAAMKLASAFSMCGLSPGPQPGP